MIPLDLMGGFVLPRVFGRQSISASVFFRRWSMGVLLQVSVFLLIGLLIIATGRLGGRFAVPFLISLVACGLLAVQGRFAIGMSRGILVESEAKVALAMDRTRQWGLRPRRVTVVAHADPGFTGGVAVVRLLGIRLESCFF